MYVFRDLDTTTDASANFELVSPLPSSTEDQIAEIVLIITKA